ncbi:MAG: hypothetical protein M3Y87_17860 [Myxococcota bacterium]|nr:hypothetical protein [Myxococcota bacterium]
MCAFSLVITACARGSDISERGGDSGRMDGGRDPADAAAGVCSPPCGDGETCSAGTCVPGTDGDEDGIDVSIDCDDTDPRAGRMLEQECLGTCGAGIERCTDGVWTECSAPTTCDCEPGTPARTTPCMNCGTQRQTCVGGRWENDGTCTGAGPCSPGEIGTGGTCGNCGTERRSCGMDCTWGAWACEGEGVCATGEIQEEMEACGGCGTGSRVRQRTCDGACTWPAFGSWSACSGGGAGTCTPGETQTESRGCGNCSLGTQSRTRTCSATTCDWGAWSGFSTCSGGGICAPGATRACANADRCGQEVCSGSCTWGACSPVVPVGSGGCLHTRPGTTTPGNNYRCCTRTSGDLTGWQFCLPPGGVSGCTWSSACDATTAC